MLFRTPPKEERSGKASDPPGTPATALLSARSGYTSSTGRTSADKSDCISNDDSPNSNTSVPSATFSSPPRQVKPRIARSLFPHTYSQAEEVDKPVIVWDMEAGSSEEESRETHTLGDSSGELAVISPARIGRKISSSILSAEGGVDVSSDPGGSTKKRDAATSDWIRRPASDVAGPTLSALKHTQQSRSATKVTTQQSNDEIFPQTAEEHRARITALINKREERQKRKEKKKKKKQYRHGDSSGSIISGASTDTYESIREGRLGDSPYSGYLKAASFDKDEEKLDAKKKKKISSDKMKSSTPSRDEASSSKDALEKSPSKESLEKWTKIQTEKVYSRPIDIKPKIIKERVSKYEMKTPRRDRAGSTASGSSNNTNKSSNAASYAVDIQFSNKTASKSASGDTQRSSPKENIPQSADEHKARLKEIMLKREMKSNQDFKSGDETSSISGISSGVSGISSGFSGVSSGISGVSSGFSGVSSKSPSKVSRGAVSGVSSASKVSRGAKSDRSSNVGSNASSRSSHASRASSANSSIFAATRAKLKGYLSSYKRKKHNRKDKKSPQTSANAQGDVETPSTNSARNTTPPNDPANAISSKPETLSSIVEMEPLEKYPEIVISTPKRQQSEDAGLEPPPLDMSPLNISPLSMGENATGVENLPWWMDKDGDQIGEEQISGHYTGPINADLQPHGRGELLIMGTSYQTFHGTWKNGRLVTPLMDLSTDVLSGPSTDTEPEPLTEDERSNSSSEEPLRGSTILQAATSTKYAINKHYTAKAKLATAPGKAAKKPRKPKPFVRYNIGDACRTPKDMIIGSSREEAQESASQLRKWDGAFIKRSCGLWTYAILIERSPQPLNVLKKRLEYFYWATVWEVDPRDEVEDSMLFAIDDDGSTKIIPEHIWAKYVRRLNPNPVPNIPKSVQEKQETASNKAQPSEDTPTPCSSPPTTTDPTASKPITEMLNKRATQETRESTSDGTGLHSRKSSDGTGLLSSIEGYFEEEFGKDSEDSGTPSVDEGPFVAFHRTISSATSRLMGIVDSERGSPERSPPQVYEYMSDTETERGFSEGSNVKD